MTHDRTPWRLIALLFVILIGFIAFVLVTMSQALAQDTVPRPNTTLQTDVGLGEILADSVPGEPAVPPAPRPSAAAVPSAAPRSVVVENGAEFDPSAYYKAKADFARERMRWEELEARRYARYSARLGGAGNPMMQAIVGQLAAGCSAPSGDGGFWSKVGGRMGRAKECREQQTTLRTLMCQQVALELQEVSVMNACVQIADSDSKWIEFWKQVPRYVLGGMAIHYGAGVISDIVGLSAFTAGRGFDAAEAAASREPTVIQTPAPIIQEPFVIEGGGGG